MLFTQNIDCLERRAGVPDSKVVEAHGSFATQHCIECKAEFPMSEMEQFIQLGDVPHCHECQGLVKPDIVFFGEQLPKRFFDNIDEVSKADAVIVMGSSLTVAPFSQLPQYTKDDVPRLLVNKEQVGGLGSRSDDVLFLGDCDAGVRNLADELGWRDELEALYKEVGGPKAQQPEGTPAAKIINDDTLGAEIDKITSEVDHALKISHGHKNWLEKHLDKKSEVIRGPTYIKEDKGSSNLDGTKLDSITEPRATPATDTAGEVTTEEPDDSMKLENAVTESSTPTFNSEPSPAPLSKPARHNETLAILHVDDVPTPDAISAAAPPTKPTSEVLSTPLDEMTSKAVDLEATIPAQAEKTREEIPVAQVEGEKRAVVEKKKEDKI